MLLRSEIIIRGTVVNGGLAVAAARYTPPAIRKTHQNIINQDDTDALQHIELN